MGKPLIIAWRNGAPVRLSDVADVQDSVENLRNEGVANGAPAVLVIGSWQVWAGRLSVGEMVVFVSYLASLYGPLNALVIPVLSIAVAVMFCRGTLPIDTANAPEAFATPLPR